MHKFHTSEFILETGDILSSSFSDILNSKYRDSRIVIMVDENTHDNCLEYLLTSFERLADAEIMLLPAGEENKVLEVCFQVWEALSEYKLGRKDLVINLGGGVVTDMGGFIAAVFKRGIDFIHIPTTLLAMVDASIGGKTGIDIGAFKNQLGVFCHPVAIYSDPIFLATLPEEELVNGFAETIKHALISSSEMWEMVRLIDSVPEMKSDPLIALSQQVKLSVVIEDFEETGLRKILNFGHTIGHAIEGFYLSDEPVSHGNAVALGIAAEAHISFQKGLLSEEELIAISDLITRWYTVVLPGKEYWGDLLQLMQQDKKNAGNKILGCVLNGIGSCVYDVEYTESEILAALEYLNSKLI